MSIKSIFIVIGVLWFAQRAAHARQVQNQVAEIMPSDPYGMINSAWETLNGAIPQNAQPGYNSIISGYDAPQTTNPCMCR